MNQHSFQRFFGNQSNFIIRLMRSLREGKGIYVPKRNECPDWVRDEIIEKAKQKRAMRSAKLNYLVSIGAMNAGVVEAVPVKRKWWKKS